jgi:hypothetical protein
MGVQHRFLEPCGYFTTKFNNQKFYVLPTEYMYVFCMNLRTNIISQHCINLLIFITHTECVSYAVRTEPLNII